MELTKLGGARVRSHVPDRPLMTTTLFEVAWPFATLVVSPDRLVLKVPLRRDYAFSPDQVTSLHTHGGNWFFKRGIRINHNVPDYPQELLFYCFGDPLDLIRKIRETGFPVPSDD